MLKWEKLPVEMQTEEIRPYYEILRKKKVSIFLKRMFDIIISSIMLLICLPLFIILSVAIKIDSKGPVFYRQTRVTRYGKEFRIFKFRTMTQNADKIGSLITVNNDCRVTRVGKFIRKCRLDEIAQLIDVFRGKMTFVGVRPEVKKYVKAYTPEMLATFLLPAGVTNLTCIYYKNEEKLLNSAENVDEVYITKILPQKMKLNLQGLKNFSFFNDIKLMFMTFFAMFGKEYKEKDITSQPKLVLDDEIALSNDEKNEEKSQ